VPINRPFSYFWVPSPQQRHHQRQQKPPIKIQIAANDPCLRDREINEEKRKNQQHMHSLRWEFLFSFLLFLLVVVLPVAWNFNVFRCLVSFLSVSFVITVFCSYQFLNPPLLTDSSLCFWSSSCSHSHKHTFRPDDPSFLPLGRAFLFHDRGLVEYKQKTQQITAVLRILSSRFVSFPFLSYQMFI